MTDTPALPPPETAPSAATDAAPGRSVPWATLLSVLAFLLLAGALVWVWQNPKLPPQQATPKAAAAG